MVANWPPKTGTDQHAELAIQQDQLPLASNTRQPMVWGWFCQRGLNWQNLSQPAHSAVQTLLLLKSNLILQFSSLTWLFELSYMKINKDGIWRFCSGQTYCRPQLGSNVLVNFTWVYKYMVKWSLFTAISQHYKWNQVFFYVTRWIGRRWEDCTCLLPQFFTHSGGSDHGLWNTAPPPEL